MNATVRDVQLCLCVCGMALWQVTKRVDTAEGQWNGWNWRTEGDMMVNGAFFVPSGEGLEDIYDKASSTDPKSSALVDVLTQNAGVLGDPRYVRTPDHVRHPVNSLFFSPCWSISLGRVDPARNHWHVGPRKDAPARLFIRGAFDFC